MAALDLALDKAGRFGLFPAGDEAASLDDGLPDLEALPDADSSFAEGN